ncbi:MAG: aminopeptidase [Candidatus Binatia bacterium]
MTPRWRRVAALAAVALTLPLGGCATGYVLRGAYEEARLLWRREPIDRMLQRDDVDTATRHKLELVLGVRQFAADELGLRVGDSYTSVARVDSGQIVHVVSAAPRDRLVPYTWWFPIVGRVPYRGYFKRAEADALAAELERDGYDTLVRPAVAFSTLGWFADPVPSTMLRLDDARLAETIIHELLHNTLYVSGQAAFNESFATFVGMHGAQAYFAARGGGENAILTARRWADALRFSRFLRAAIARLEAAYAGGIDEASRQVLFEELQAQFRAEPWETDSFASFATQPLNNAVLVHDRLYADRLDAFDAALRDRGGDLRATIAAVSAAARDATDPYAALTAQR